MMSVITAKVSKELFQWLGMISCKLLLTSRWWLSNNKNNRDGKQ